MHVPLSRDPRRTGEVWFCSYWKQYYLVIAPYSSVTHRIVIKWEDRSELTTHCTPVAARDCRVALDSNERTMGLARWMNAWLDSGARVEEVVGG